MKHKDGMPIYFYYRKTLLSIWPVNAAYQNDGHVPMKYPHRTCLVTIANESWNQPNTEIYKHTCVDCCLLNVIYVLL